MMQNGRMQWLLALPLMAAGCVGSHTVAYKLVDSASAEPDHGYLALAPLVLAVGVALLTTQTS